VILHLLVIRFSEVVAPGAGAYSVESTQTGAALAGIVPSPMEPFDDIPLIDERAITDGISSNIIISGCLFRV
jgi:hypothetical protein